MYGLFGGRCITCTSVRGHTDVSASGLLRLFSEICFEIPPELKGADWVWTNGRGSSVP